MLQQTRTPYELIIIDNGSNDGTPKYLDGLRSRPGPVRVDVVRNETNVGFPAGCNQALARARGRFLVEDFSIGGLDPGDRPFFVAKHLSLGVSWLTAFRRVPEITITSVELTGWQMLVERSSGE